MNSRPKVTRQSSDTDIVRHLANLLRENGEKILDGASRLALTTHCLTVLNKCFSQLAVGDLTTSFEVAPASSPCFPVFNDIHFLYDLMQKTLALKILHDAQTLQGRVNVSLFRALKTLEIKKTPLHLIEGLHKLRSQLHIVTCTRSIASLHELFEACGGDMSGPMSWPELHTASVSNNNLHNLDDSLRLLPVIEVLDISHNALKDTHNYLEYLTELTALNASCNQLDKVPSFSIDARNRLQTLVLANNYLESDQGLSSLAEMLCLCDLDLSNNCLTQHSWLSPLRALPRLRKLKLLGNPLAQHPRHRFLTAEHINIMAADRLILDGKRLSSSELMQCRKSASTQYNIQGSPSQLRIPNAASNSSFDIFERSYEYESSNTEGELVSPVKQQRRRSRMKRRSRKATIADMDNTHANMYDTSPEGSKASTPLPGSYLEVKENLETIRNQLGPDWLQMLKADTTAITQDASPSIYTNRQSPTPLPSNPARTLNNKTVSGSPSQPIKACDMEKSQPIRKRETNDDLYLNGDETVNEQIKSFEKEKSQSARNSVTEPLPVKNLGKDHSNTNGIVPFIVSAEVTAQKNDEEEDEEDMGIVITAKGTPYEDTRETFSQMAERPKSLNPFESDMDTAGEASIISHIAERPKSLNPFESDVNAEADEDSDIVKLPVESDTGVAPLGPDAGGFEDIFKYPAQHGDSAANDNTDYGTESEPYIVMLASGEQLLVTLTERFLLEKDLDGNLVETLDLKCLLSLQRIEEQPLKGDGGSQSELKSLDKPPVVRLNFTYQRRDRRERRYTMESDDAAQEFLEALQPSLAARQEALMLQDKMQCLKCGLEFRKSSAPRKIRRTSAVNNIAASNMNSLMEGGNQQLDDLEEAPTCPGCDGSMLISLDAETVVREHNSASTTPIASLSNTPTATSPIAMSSAKTSPWQADASDKSLSPSTIYKSVLDANSGSYKSLNGSAGSSSASSSVLPFEAYRVSDKPPVVRKLSMDNQPSAKNTIVTSTNSTTLQSNSSCDNISELDERKRHSSADSDILVLSQHSSSHSREFVSQMSMTSEASNASEITLRTNPSQSSLTILEGTHSTPSVVGTLPLDGSGYDTMVSSQATDLEVTPCGSLTNSTLSSMLETVYDKTIYDRQYSGAMADSSPSSITGDAYVYKSSDEADGTPVSLPATPRQGFVGSREVGMIKYWYDDFTRVDHRLKLYFEMHLFEEENEEFSLLLRCDIVQHTKPDEFSGLLIVSSHNFYILRITDANNADTPDKWLRVISCQPITNLQYIDIGLGYQSFRIEFTGTEVSSFTMLIREDAWCQNFISQLTGVIQQTAFSSDSRLQGITKNNPRTLANLELQVLLASTSSSSLEDKENANNEGAMATDEDEAQDVDATLLKYILCYQVTGELDEKGERSLGAVSLILSPTHLCLAQENHHWSTSAEPGGATVSSTQFHLKDKQKVTDVTHVEIHEREKPELMIHFQDEETSEEYSWHVVMETSQSLKSFLEALKEPWQNQFGIELQVLVAS